MDCSSMGIEPDGRKAHLIPYGNKCNLVVDYKGLVDLARRSGEIADIHADVVCAKDTFEYSFGSEAKLIHKPNLSYRGKVIAAYSFVRLKDNSSSYEVMNIDEIEAVRKRSKASGSGPWVTDWNEMAKKTVFRRHSKWLPLSSEFQEAIEKDFDVPSDFSNGVVQTASEIKMPKPLAVEPKAQEPAQAQPSETSDLDLPATDKQIENIKKLADQVGIKDEAMLDFLTECGVSNPDEITVREFQVCIQQLMKKIDEKAKINAKQPKAKA